MRTNTFFLVALFGFFTSCVNLENKSAPSYSLFFSNSTGKTTIKNIDSLLFAVPDSGYYKKQKLVGSMKIPTNGLFAYKTTTDTALWYIARLDVNGDSLESFGPVSDVFPIRYFIDSFNLAAAFASRVSPIYPWRVYDHEGVILSASDSFFVTPVEVGWVDGLLLVTSVDGMEQVVDPWAYEFPADLDTTRPYQVPSGIIGFEDDLVLASPFAGSSPENQIVWMAIHEDMVTVCKPNCECAVYGETIFPGYQVFLHTPPNLFGEVELMGSDTVRKGGNVWETVYRIVVTDSLRYGFESAQKQQELDSLKDVGSSMDIHIEELEKVVEQGRQRRCIQCVALLLLVFVGFLYACYYKRVNKFFDGMYQGVSKFVVRCASGFPKKST